MLLSIAALLGVVMFWWFWTGRSAKNAPPVMHGMPLIGCMLDFAKGPVGFVTEGYKKMGDVFTARIFNQKLTFMVGPDAQGAFFKANDEELRQRDVYKFTVPCFGKGVVYDCEPKETAQQLRFLSGGLSTDALTSYVPLFLKEAEQFFERWGDEGVVDLREELSELIILTASRCLLGEEARNHMHARVHKLYLDLDGGMQALSFFAPHLPTPAHRRRDAARKEMVELFRPVIAKRRASGEKHMDLLQVLIDARYRDGTALVDDQIVGMLIAALFAGQHTSAVTSSWTGLLLSFSKDKKIYKDAVQEQVDVMKKHGDELSLDIIKEMDVLHRCMKEALRMFPPLIMLMRRVKKPVEYKGMVIPPGHTVVVSPAVGMRLPDVFKNPDEFDPDRFAEPREEDKVKKFSYLAFGGGRHACMGEQFAFNQVKTIWSVLLRKFEIELVDPLPEPDYTAMVVGPKAPCRVRYKRRKKALV